MLLLDYLHLGDEELMVVEPVRPNASKRPSKPELLPGPFRNHSSGWFQQGSRGRASQPPDLLEDSRKSRVCLIKTYSPCYHLLDRRADSIKDEDTDGGVGAK